MLMSRSEEVEVLREVAAAINCLSSVEENKMEIASRATNTIIGLMLSGNIFSVTMTANTYFVFGKVIESLSVMPFVLLRI